MITIGVRVARGLGDDEEKLVPVRGEGGLFCDVGDREREVVRERDLKEEWSIDPITEEGMPKLREERYDASIIKVPTYADLLAIAAEAMD